MPLAATWLDLVVGVGIHMVMVPTPAGPVPTPLPHPFVGLTGDPAGAMVGEVQGALMSLATEGTVKPPPGPVLINGVPALTTSDRAKNAMMMVHIPTPPGVGFASPPEGDATLPLGALAVTYRGSSAVRGGDPALSCSNPVRLPTSTVIALPKGAPVMVGGPPGMNVAQAVTDFAVGKMVRTAWGEARGLFKYVGRLSPTRLRNLIPKAKCFLTGHPVDVATGRVITWDQDFTFRGPLPLPFERNYASSWSGRDGVLGPGWSHTLDQAVWREGDNIVARVADGREIVFDASDLRDREIPIKHELFDPVSRCTLRRVRGPGWVLITPDGLVHHFEPVSGGPPGPGARNELARLVRISKRNRKIGIDVLYGESGRLVAVRDSGGRVTKFEHDDTGRLTRILLPDAHSPEQWVPHVRYTYSERGTLVEVCDAMKHSRRYAYDGRLLVQETDRAGLSFFWIYNGRGAHARCVRTWGSGGIFNQKLDYDPQNRATIVSNSYGKNTMYRMNELGAVVEIMDPEGNTRRREYDGALNLIRESDALGQKTEYSYDPFGNVSIIRSPDDQRVVLKHHRVFPELPVLLRDECGAIWRRTYDSEGQLRELRGPIGGDRTRFEWKDGLLAAVVGPGGRRTEHTYDRRGNSTTSRLPNGAEVRREFDYRGRLTATVTPAGAREEIEYDLLDRVVRVRGPDGNVSEATYDPEGNPVEATSAAGSVKLAYVGFNWLASREEAGVPIRFAYGAEGELKEVRNERGHAHTFTYDACGRVVEEVGFSLTKTSYEYDRAGRPIVIAGPIGKVQVAYDSMGRILERTFPDGQRHAFAYREDGALISATNATCSVAFQRDEMGRVVREQRGDDWIASRFGPGGERAFFESSLGARMALDRDPTGNPTVLWLGPLHGLQRTEIQIAYDVSGAEVERRLPAGVVSTWGRDPAGRPTVRTVTTPTHAWSARLVWGSDDRLESAEDTRFGSSSFEHDARGWLVSATFGDEVQHRVPDEVGNIYRTPDRSDRSFARGGRIREDKRPGVETRYAFDAAGNIAQKIETAAGSSRRWDYTWDATGMLTAVHPPDGAKVTFAYDALGRRVSKKAGEVETRWVWDLNAVLHEIRTDAPSAVTWYHEPETFAPLARSDSESTSAFVPDHLGVPTAMYDRAGKLSWEMQLDLYGVPRPTTSGETQPSGICPWRWPGQYEDPETGLHYNRFRYYDPTLGAYMSRDPIGVGGGLAMYAYTRDPLAWIDPFGLAACKSGADVTTEVVRAAMVGAPVKTHQRRVSMPVVRRYVDKLAAGGRPPPIAVDRGIIVEGNHRYVAGRVFGVEPAQYPATLAEHKIDQPTIDWADVVLDPRDWGNK